MLNDNELRVLKRINAGTSFPDQLRDVFGTGYSFQCRKLIAKKLITRENKIYKLTEQGKKELEAK